MKVRFLKIFLILFILVLPVSVFGVGDGFDPVNIDIPDETGGGYAGHCDLKNVGKTCTANATKSKASMGICRNYSGTPSCAAQECNKGYYLWLDSKGNSQGVCHSLEEAQKRCDKNKTLCSNGEVFSPNIVPNPKLTDKLKALGGQQQAWKGCVCQPNCEGVYRDNIEALTCCKYENATWDKKQGRCNCTQEGYNWKYSNGQGECVPPKQPVVPNKEPCPDGADGTPPNCQCSEPQSKYVSERNSCECPDDKPVFENGQCIAPTKCPDGATGTPPNCQCGGSKSKYVLETNSCECPDDRPTFENGQCIAPTKCPDGATGTPPNCQCGGPKSKYVLETNSCECPDDKPVFKNGQCIAVVQKPECPKDATGTPPNCKCTDSKKIYDKNKNQCVSNKLEELKQQYEDAKANEQSTANRRLTALTTAATGIGGMELAQGIAEKSADKDAQLNMDAYIATMRCTYGNGKSVKASLSEVELPGGNDATIMQYRNEYMTLASDLKQRKESLGMKPGIESEVIYDKSTMGLYDEENVGISGGNYASLYRAKMLGSESDQAKIKEEQETTSNRIKGGAIALGGGMAVGLVGDSLINGKLGETLGLRETKDDTDKKSDDDVNNESESTDVVETRTTDNASSDVGMTDTETETIDLETVQENTSGATSCKFKGRPGRSCNNVIPDRTHVLKARYDANGCCVVTCKKGYTRTDDDTCIPNAEHQQKREHGRLLQSEVINKDNIQQGIKTGGDVIKTEIESSGKQLESAAALAPLLL